jgi:predicted nuclease with TOPRIM domain
MSSAQSESASELLSKANELSTQLKRLKSTVQLYTKVTSLKTNLDDLEKKYESLQSKAQCKKQCNKLNKKDSNNVDDFLIDLLLLKVKASSSPIVPESAVVAPAQFVEDYRASAPPLFEEEASAPPLFEEEASVPQASAPP